MMRMIMSTSDKYYCELVERSIIRFYPDSILVLINQYSLVFVTFLENTFKTLTLFVCLPTVSIFKVFCKLTLINCPIVVYPFSIALSQTTDKVTLIVTSIGPLVLTLTIRFALFVRTYVFVSI